MGNIYFEIEAGRVLDVTKSTPKELAMDCKYIVKGGDFIVFSRVSNGIRVVRGKGDKLKVEEFIRGEGVYLLTPVHVEPIAKLNVKYRRLYGMLRENYGEDFYLIEDKKIDKPFQIYLNLEVDIVLKYRFDIVVNTDHISHAHNNQIKTLIDNTLQLDLSSLAKLSNNPLMITVDESMLVELGRLINIGKTRLAV